VIAVGGKNSEMLKFGTKKGEEILIPLCTITGGKPGPTAVVTAGIHGCEYPGIAAAIRLFKMLRPEDVYGTVKIVTVSSVSAFEARSMFVTPADRKNPNRFFPGNPDGTYSDVLDYYIMEIIKTGDYYIDLHGGDMVEDLEPFAIYHKGEGEDLDNRSYEIAKYYGLPNIVSTVTDGKWPDNGTTYANAAKIGVPGAIVEAGAVGRLDEESTQKHIDGLTNVLRRFGSLEGYSAEPEEQRIFSDMVWVFSNHKGIFYISVKPGDEVEVYDQLGRIEDYFGELLEESRSPVKGRVLFTTSSPAVSSNGLLMGIGIYRA
jgi:predicted deacylase